MALTGRVPSEREPRVTRPLSIHIFCRRFLPALRALLWAPLLWVSHAPASHAGGPATYAESQWISFSLDPADIRLVVKGKSLVYLTTRGTYKAAQPDEASYFLNTSLLDCSREYQTTLSWRTFTSDGVPLRVREYKQLQPAIDEALLWLADPSLNGTFVADDLKRLCAVVSRWMHEYALLPGVPTLVQATSVAQRSIPLTRSGGVYSVGVKVNDSITMQFVVDSGAADVTLPSFVGKTLFASGAITKADVLGAATYTLADGTSMRGTVVNLRSLLIGDVVIRNVRAAILPTDDASLLLGQSALRKLGTWRIDASANRLVIAAE